MTDDRMTDDRSDGARCAQSEQVEAYVVHALPANEVPALETHLAGCAQCRKDLELLRPITDKLVSWPTDVLRPASSLQARLSERIAGETGGAPVLPPPKTWSEPEWEEAAPGIFVKLLANDGERRRVSMLVRLIPGAIYPPHVHAGVEELHLLDGQLWIDDRLLYPGDYNYGRPGDGDKRVYSETGCTCVLITSTDDVLG